MLLRYAVKNYKSIGDTVEFSMMPTVEDEREQFVNTIKTDEEECKLLYRGIFFGANASGKTSLFESINFARNFVINGHWCKSSKNCTKKV